MDKRDIAKKDIETFWEWYKLFIEEANHQLPTLFDRRHMAIISAKLAIRRMGSIDANDVK